ncbi:MAG: C4-dicarboxylate ABC transporter permease [Firmicutes bacterium HGW-Firmicutes-12]|nr:MAG: C4-dicarboxylate ABC transporter permease [Firmicutes bacterium HGW-Firmicutes-12]
MAILQYLHIIFEPLNFALILLGLVIGIIFGMLPGLSGVTAVAVILPFSYSMSPVTALIFMSSIYCSSVYSGSISAILFKSPGDAPAFCTTFDGYPLTLKGEGQRALVAALASSGIGGIIGILIALVGATYLARIGLKFGPVEYFALGILGLSLVATVGNKSVAKGIISVSLGLLVSCIGFDSISGIQRFTFGSINLLSGVYFIPVIIGLFAVSEVFNQFSKLPARKKLEIKMKSKIEKMRFLSKEDVKLALPHWIRNSFVGAFIGMLPGAGATVSALIGYGISHRFSKNKDQFGKGAIEGVVGPETANNAAVGGALVPLLTLGIPGSATTAIMLSVFLIHGLQPGPFLFRNSPETMYPIFLSMIVINILILVIPYFLMKHIVRILEVPYEYLGSLILLLSVLGAYALNNRIYDVWIVFIFGVVGYLMNRYGFSPAALILGLVLGTMIEEGYRKSMILFRGDVMALFDKPIAVVLLLIALAILIFSILPGIKVFLKNLAGKSEVAK